MTMFFRAAKLFAACMLAVFIVPLYAQETPPGDELSGYMVFPEDEEGLTVTGTVETSQQMAVIDKEEIEKHNTPDLAVLLRETLGIGSTRYGGRGNMANINLRGFDSKRVALLIDGVPVNSAVDGKIDIDQIDLHSVERIEVIYGGSDTKYNVSGALGGVINIITVKEQKSGLVIGGSASNTSTIPGEYTDRNEKKQSPHTEDLFDSQHYSLEAAYGGNAFSLNANVFANRSANHFLFKDYANRIRRKDNNEVWDTGADVSGVWNVSDAARLIASSNFFYGGKNIPASGFSSSVGNQRDMSARNGLMLDVPRAFHDDLAAEASLTHAFANRAYTSPNGAESTHDQNDLMLINRWNWYPGQRITLRSGFDYRFIHLDSSEIGNRTRHDGGVYITAELSPWDALLVIPSLKVISSSGGGKATPVPKLGLVLSIGEAITIKNNYFRSFKFPDFEELYWSGGGGYGNPDLRPEDGWGADLGVTWRFRELFRLENVVFAQWTKDSIHWYSKKQNIWRPENVGKAVFFGMDNKLRFEIPVSIGPVHTLAPSFSYQYLLSYLLSYGYDYDSNKRIPYMPGHSGGASLGILWNSGSFIASFQYESTRYHDTANLTELEPQLLFSVTANQKIGERFSVFAAVRNMFNRSYESFYGYPMPGCTITLGLKAQFEIQTKNKDGI